MDLIGETMTDAQLDHMLELADIDKDGRINYQGLFSPLAHSLLSHSRV
jgi:Ca2+-binding EF-hand superfamily protein